MANKRFCLGLVFLFSSYLLSNPIMVRFFNELYIGPNGWALEFHHNAFDVRLDTCLLATRSDTARFITKIELYREPYTVVTSDSLDHPIEIHGSGDTLSLLDLHHRPLDRFQFSSIPVGYSLNRLGSYSTYLDRTPTIGAANDTSGAMGWVCGTVSDEKGIPLPDISIDWEYSGGDGHRNKSDAFGQYRLRTLAGLIYVWFHREGYQNIEKMITMHPDSTIFEDIVLQKNPDAVEDRRRQSQTRFRLSDNFPNPFNSVTSFLYGIPDDGFTDVEVFDIRGKPVETLFRGFQKRGEYRLFWDAFEAPSGIYFCRLQSGSTILVKKWVLIQ